ncbi:MAG: DUF1934 domain-containing protein [Clostridia bacterium]|nr:DUF1934 domain-containing protein [Clostridia bacterium]
MKCKISLDNGKNGVFTARGDLNFGAEGFALFYELDGDKCLLTYKNGTIVQERRGNVTMKMVFSQGKQTECTLGEGGLSGSFPVFTNKIQIENDPKSVDIKLYYNCAGESVALHVFAAAY